MWYLSLVATNILWHYEQMVFYGQLVVKGMISTQNMELMIIKKEQCSIVYLKMLKQWNLHGIQEHLVVLVWLSKVMARYGDTGRMDGEFLVEKIYLDMILGPNFIITNFRSQNTRRGTVKIPE